MEKVRVSIERLLQFLKEVRQEFKKITWPAKREVISSTIVVILSTFAIAFFLGFIDLILQKLLSYFIR